MSRIFRRPMFRKGGNVGEGIMTGIVDREMHNESNPNGVGAQNAPVDFEKQYIDKITAAGAGSQGMDPLTAYLLAAGPAISSGTSFSDAIGKLADPNKQLIELMNKRASDERNLKVGAAQFGLEKGFERSETEADRKFKTSQLEKEIQARKDLANLQTQSENNIDNVIRNQAIEASRENRTNLYDEETRLTWQLKTSRNLKQQGLKIGDNNGILTKTDMKNINKKNGIKKFAENQIKKGNSGSHYIDLKNNIIYQITKDENNEPVLKEVQIGVSTSPNKVVEETKVVDQPTSLGDIDKPKTKTVGTMEVVDKLSPQDLGFENKPVFESLDEIRQVIEFPMTGKEIKRLYEFPFPINDKTVFQPINNNIYKNIEK
mgnify:FL=1